VSERGEPFFGRPTLALANGHVRVEVLAESGPRIVRLFLPDTPMNLLAETPDVAWETPWGRYELLGGHRLWCAPEDPPWTSVPEADDAIASELPRGLRLERLERPTQLRKAIEVELVEGAAEVRLRHVVRNEGAQPRTLAPWAITMLRLGGLALLPQQLGPLAGMPRLPNRSLVLWPYSSWAEPRLQLSDELVLVRGEAGRQFKLGQLSSRAVAGYLVEGVLFCKRFAFDPEQRYPDFGCNLEAYCDENAIELESLAPVVELAPGEEVRHVERWLLRRVEQGTTPRQAAALLAALA
jgi:hypothetical protein